MSRKKNPGKKSGKNKVTLAEEVYKYFAKNPGKIVNYKQVSAEIDVHDEPTRILINVILSELADRNLLKEIDRGRFKLITSQNIITGKADLSATGMVYVISEESEKDVSILPKKTKNVLSRDLVRVLVYPARKGHRPEGEIVEIVQRDKTQFVGIVQESKNFSFVVPNSNKIPYDFFVGRENLNGAKDGEKVLIEVIDWNEDTQQNPIAKVKEVLGLPGDNNTEMHAILAEYGLPLKFPENVEKLAEKIPTEITKAEIEKRRDFRATTTFTIDPVDAKDFDDALSIKKLDNGNWEMGVHIADVSHYLKEKSTIDEEAVKRATSVYLVDRCIPMLPEVLSNNLCSLRPNEEKLCFSAVFEMTDEAEIVSEWFGRTVIESDRRFTYEEAQEIIETKEGELKEEILTYDRLAKILRAERFKKGAINFNSIEVKFHLDPNGRPTGVFFKESKDSNQLIEEFMLLANKKVAEFIGKTAFGKGEKQPVYQNKKPQTNSVFVYRVHDKPSQEKISAFAEFVNKLGYKFKGGSDKNVSESMNALMVDIKGKGEEAMLEQLAIRTMAKAHYTTDNIGHYGLAFEHYTHFTSPIRRYPDVMVHRLLDHYLQGGASANKNEYEALCEHSSNMEKLAAEAERASTKYKQVEYLKDRIGMEFNGVVTGATEWGIFVELVENKCEGLIRLKELPGDFYVYDEENFCVTGKKTGKRFRIGDKVRVEVKKADLIKKQIDFIIVD